jgi:glycosyltransferase involved in cell wall biosynthesis
MSRILFIIPAFKHGGTNKSLTNILSFINKDFDITILALSHLGPYKVIFEKEVTIIKKDSSLGLLYDDFGTINFKNDSIKQTIIKIANKAYRKLYKTIIGEKGIEKILDQAAKNVEKLNFDTIISMQEGTATDFASRINGNKVAWVRSDYNEYHKIIGINESDTYEKFQAIICVSEYTKNTFISKYPQLKSKCYGIHNMIDYKRIIDLSNEPIDENKQFESDTFTIISIGRLSKVKQFNLIPMIVKDLVDKGVELKWYIIGDGEERQIIYDLIKKNRVEKHVFLLGEINNPYPYIKHSDLVAVTSFSEACPNVLNESKILHTPVITTDFGSAKEFIENGVNGIITDEINIVKDIARLIEEDNYYNKIKLNIQGFIYSNDKIINQIINLIK